MSSDAYALSVVVLCYRAGESIHDVLDPLCDLLDRAAIRYELVLVANYWPERLDETPRVVRAFASSRDNVVVLDEEKQGAMGWDMRKGLAAATGEIRVVIAPSELQEPGVGVVQRRVVGRRIEIGLGSPR